MVGKTKTTMDEERFVSSRENPRNLGFVLDRGGVNKSTVNDLIQKPPPPSILDRFRSLLKELDDDLRDDGAPPPTTEDIVRLYELVLSELSFNSKPIITDLTIIAGDHSEHGEGIADAICARIIEAPVDQKLPSLYLLDSIVKNIGREYIRHFSVRLPEVFREAYRQVNPNQHSAMRHLFGTWSNVFTPSVLRKIEAQMQLSPPHSQQPPALTTLRASESPRPSHGIHVNPKYLEARRLDSNIQHTSGPSLNPKLYGQKPTIGYDDYDSDYAELTSSRDGGQRPSPLTGPSFVFGAEKPLPSSIIKVARPPSPLRVRHDRSSSPPVDDFPMDTSPRRHVPFDYRLGRVAGFEASMSYNHQSNGIKHQGPRALIDAYGNDRGKRTPSDRPQQLDFNGAQSKVASKTWQNTEEEEYVWEDMSPTLADSRSKDMFSSSSIPHGSFSTRPDLGRSNTAVPSEPDHRRSNWPSQAQQSVVDDSSISIDAAPPLGSGRGFLRNKIPGLPNETTRFSGAHNPQEPWNLPSCTLQSSQQSLNARGPVGNMQLPFPTTEMPSSVSEKMPALINTYSDADPLIHRPPTIRSRIGSPFESSPLEGVSSVGPWPPVNAHNSHPFPLAPIPPPQKPITSQFDLPNVTSSVMNQAPNKPLYFPEQRLDNVMENKVPIPKTLPYFSSQQAGLIPLNQPNQAQLPSLQPQFLMSPSVPAPFPSTLGAPLSSRTYAPQVHGGASSHPRPMVRPPLSIPNMFGNTFPFRGVALPPLPPGPPPSSSQVLPQPQNLGPTIPNQPPGGAFSGLINSLVAQGFISLNKPASTQESVGVDFNPDLLKVRHESSISSLYTDLPRQCKTCGLRFKCQEEHSTHMDWHVTKNRVSKSRKQKPSRKWFVSTNMWLSGAEALGADAVPGFLPSETIVEKRDDEEFSVPADEDQNVCELCGEPFDDFYSDETEEWMYKGAVYLNAPDGTTLGMDRSQLGPIVHAKCRTDSSVIFPEDFGQDEGGNTEEGRQRKRMRILA